MQVTRIEIFGFKSFLEKLMLPIGPGVTGVVGPNGCGKSNVVDALRWVLGETKASNLRGSVLEDVIFNGTENLRPLGLAEVTLTIRASRENIFADLLSRSDEMIQSLAPVEVVVQEISEESARQVENELGASAQLGGEASDASETEERPLLTVLQGGKDLLNAGDAVEVVDVIPQTEGEQSVDPVALEIPELVAAEAAASNEVSHAWLNRYAWLKGAVEVQITRRLYRSGEAEFFINRVPARLKDIKEFVRAIGMGARAYTIVAQGEVSRIVTAKPEDRRMILEEAAGVVGFRDQIGAAERRLEETHQSFARMNDIIIEVTKQVGSLKRQAARAINRRELKTQLELFEREIFIEQLLDQADQAREIEMRREQMVHLEQEGQTQLTVTQVGEEEERGRMLALDVETDSMRRKIDHLREELMERERRRTEESSRLRELRSRLGMQREEIDRLEERRETIRDRQTEAEREREILMDRDSELAAELGTGETGFEDELRDLAIKLHDKRDEIRAHEQVIREARDRVVEQQSSLKALREQLVAASPLFRFGDALRERSDDVALFIEQLRVPTELTLAVQAALAEKAQFVMSSRPMELAELFRERVSPDNDEGQAFGVFERRPADGLTQRKTTDLPWLLDSLEITEESRPLAQRVFGGVFLAPNWGVARTARDQLAPHQVIITLDGDVLTDCSYYSFRNRSGMVSLRVRVEALESNVGALEAKYDILLEKRHQLDAELTELEAEHSRTLDDAQIRQAAVRELMNQQGTIRGRLYSEQRVLEQLGQDLGRLEIEVLSARDSLGSLEVEEQMAVEAVAALIPDEEEELRTSVYELRAEYERLEDMRREGRENLSRLTIEVETKRRQLESVRAQLSHDLLQVQRKEIEREHLLDLIRREYGNEWAEEVSVLSRGAERMEAELRREREEDVSRIKTRIVREGEVDPSSIEQFEVENARLENLVQQRSDLESAVLTIKRTIERLAETSKQRFLTTFEAVRAKFSEFAPKLFGGGKANLELTDPNNPLDSGVDIQVRPPGKKPKSMELLSGGEKALCATALIFAMFMERPSPLCVLDEVDAPLDEANLMRFLAFVKEMSLQTQFIMITHNKQSMQVADRLAGVTMEIPGASKVISVSLQDAMSHVA